MVLEGGDADSLDGSEFSFVEGSREPVEGQTEIDPNGSCWAELPPLDAQETQFGDNGGKAVCLGTKVRASARAFRQAICQAGSMSSRR